MSLIERTTVTDALGTVIEQRDRRLYSISELKAGGDDITSSAYTKALEWMYEGAAEYDWWASCLDDLVDQVSDKFGITYDPKNVSFDIERGQYVSFGKADVDDRKVLKLAKVDMRTKIGRTLLDDGIAIGEQYGYGNTRNWIGYASWGGWPDYIPQDIADRIEQVLRDAQDFVIDALRGEFDWITGEEHLFEMADANEYTFDRTGHRA